MTNQERFEQLLDAMEPEVRKAFLDAIERIKSEAVLSRIEELIAAGDIDGLLDELKLYPDYFTGIQDAVEDAYYSGAQFQAQIGVVLSSAPFNRRHERAERVVREQGAKLIVNVTESVREGVRVQVEQAMSEGKHPTTVARALVGVKSAVTKKRTGGGLGLTSQQVQFVNSARDELLNLDSSYFKRKARDRRFDAKVRKAIKTGTPLSAKDIATITSRYEAKLLRLRAEVIARTETLTALNAGRYEMMAQNAEFAGVPLSSIKVKWQAARDNRTRETHRHLNEKTVTYGEYFVTIEGNYLKYPGDASGEAPGEEIINCRCSVTFDFEV